MAYAYKYPRRTLIRSLIRLGMYGLLKTLTRPQIDESSKIPKKGPLIVVGNHTGVLEVVMLTVFTPWMIEFMGSVDLPHGALVDSVVGAYGFIPIRRGTVSRASMQAGVDILKQGGILGIFPEGGLWEPAIRHAHTGVAWLSYYGQAPILPIGFSTTKGKASQALRLERPTLKMHIGEPLPPVQVSSGQPRKAQYAQAAQAVMDAIWELVPEEDKLEAEQILDEQFELIVKVSDSQGKDIPIPEKLQPQFGPSLSKLLHRPALFNGLLHNLRLPVQALRDLPDQPPIKDLLTATQAALNYLKHDNPYYFTYRYGQRQGSAMRKSIEEIHALAEWALASQLQISAIPIRRYRSGVGGREIIERRPVAEDQW